MTKLPSTEIVIVKRGEKEGKLKEFVRSALAPVDAVASADGALDVLVLARSLDSPIMRTLSSALAEHSHARFRVRCILFTLDATDDGTGRTPSSGMEFAHQVRLVRDARLVDVHEQLVLGGSVAWIGDSIRREPEKRDSFETFAAACPVTASWSTKAFDRIWHHAEPVVARSSAAVTETLAGMAMDALSQSSAVATTRN